MPVFETPGKVAIRIELPAGAVKVETWDEPRVEIDVSPRRNDDTSRAIAAETRVEASERGGRHVVTVEAPKRDGRLFSFGRTPELLVSVRCPEDTDVELDSHSADLVARGTLGEVGARTAAGDVVVGDAHALQVTTASGDVAAATVDGALVVKTASGDVDVGRVGGRSTVNTVSGDVRRGATDAAASVGTVSGDIELDGAAAGVRVNSVSGDVEVAVAAGLGFWIDAQSVSGTIESELEVGDGPGGADGPEHELRVRTVSGDVRFTRVGVRAG